MTEGWGLGLSLVKNIAEAHGGEVQVKSDKDNGTTFILWLTKNAK
jgi:signal transduction histidine kinase